MSVPFTLPLDVEVWADREADIEQLVAELNEAEKVKQPEPESAL